MNNAISIDVIEAVLRSSFDAMLTEDKQDNNLAAQSYIEGYLTALNDFSKNLTAFLNSDSTSDEIQLNITITSPNRKTGGSDEK